MGQDALPQATQSTDFGSVCKRLLLRILRGHGWLGLSRRFFYIPINYYGYFTTPPFPLGDESIEERVERHKGIMHDVLPRMDELWDNEWLPSMMPGIDRAKSTDYGSLSDSELLTTLGELKVDLQRRFVVHGKINFVLE